MIGNNKGEYYGSEKVIRLADAGIKEGASQVVSLYDQKQKPQRL